MKLREKKEVYLLEKPQEPRADSSLQGVNPEGKVCALLPGALLPQGQEPLSCGCPPADRHTFPQRRDAFSGGTSHLCFWLPA